MIRKGALNPEGEEMQPEKCLQTCRHSTQHNTRVPSHSRAENCQQSDIPKHPAEAGRPETVSQKDQAGVPKAAGWPVAGGETPLGRQEAVATGIRRTTKFEKVNDQLNKV